MPLCKNAFLPCLSFYNFSLTVAGNILSSNFRMYLFVCSARLRVRTVCGRILAKWAKKPLYIARKPSVFTVLIRQSNTPLYRLPVWLYIRDIIVSFANSSVSVVHHCRRFGKHTRWMHDTADYKSTARATCQMQRCSLSHIQMLY